MLDISLNSALSGHVSADSLQAELHQVTMANTVLAAENMQIKHEMQHTVSAQMHLELSKQVCLYTQCVLATCNAVCLTLEVAM